MTRSRAVVAILLTLAVLAVGWMVEGPHLRCTANGGTWVDNGVASEHPFLYPDSPGCYTNP